jgi:hypothetical protein
VRYHSDSPQKFSKADIDGMLEFLVGNIFVVFGDQFFQQYVGIPISTNCAHLLVDLFLYSYEADFFFKKYWEIKKNKKERKKKKREKKA